MLPPFAINGAQRPLREQSPRSLLPQPRCARVRRWLASPPPQAKPAEPPPQSSLRSFPPLARVAPSGSIGRRSLPAHARFARCRWFSTPSSSNISLRSLPLTKAIDSRSYTSAPASGDTPFGSRALWILLHHRL